MSRILRASAQIKKCTKLNGSGSDHSHDPTLAVRIIRTIRLTMAQVNQKVCSPIPSFFGWGEGTHQGHFGACCGGGLDFKVTQVLS